MHASNRGRLWGRNHSDEALTVHDHCTVCMCDVCRNTNRIMMLYYVNSSKLNKFHADYFSDVNPYYLHT